MEVQLTPQKRFWRLLNPDKKEIQNVYIYSIFIGLVNLSLPLGIQAIVNLIQGGQVSTSWIVLVTIVVAGVAVAGIFQIFQLKITENLQQKIFTRAAFEFAYRIPRIKMEALYRHYAPELMNRFFDTISVQKGLSKIIVDFSAASLQIIFGLILLSFYHPFFIIFSIVLIAAVAIFLNYSIPNGLRTSLQESQHKYEVAHWLEEVARTFSTFKLTGDSKLPMQRMNRHVDQYLDAREDHFKVLVNHYTIMVVFKVLVAAGLLAIGGILVMEQQMNIGQFIAAEIIILLVMASVERLIVSSETIYDVLTSLEKIGQVTDLELERTEGLRMTEQEGWNGLKVELRNLSFNYPEHPVKTLDSLNLNIDPGQRVLISGKNGSGKSTLLQVIAALYDHQEGILSYDDLNIESLHLNDLQSVIGDCLSQEQLFVGTLKENIIMGRPNVSFDDVKWAVENLGLLPFVKSQPSGYDCIIEPQGRKLPRSIVQKLILARSIVDRPRLLLLEDAFEHIDKKERYEIMDFLLKQEHSWTLIAVSSDEHLANLVDRVVIMEDGRVIEDRKLNQKSENQLII